MTLLPNRNSNYRGIDLFVTIQERNFDKLVHFLNCHGGLDVKNEYERTALMECIVEYMSQQDTSAPIENDFAKRLVEMGADINVKDKGGYTALHFAMQENNQDMLDFLLVQPQLDRTILPDVIMKALHFHSRDGALLIKLIQAGDPFQGDDMTLYEHLYAFQTGEIRRGDGPVDMTKVLQVLHALYPEKVDHVEPFFLESIQYDFLSSEFRALMNKKKADLLMGFVNEHGGINGVDEYGRTPLICCMAAYPGPPRGSDIKRITTTFSKKLIAMGADIHVKDKDGCTALDFAIKNNNTEIADIIKSQPDGQF